MQGFWIAIETWNNVITIAKLLKYWKMIFIEQCKINIQVWHKDLQLHTKVYNLQRGGVSFLLL